MNKLQNGIISLIKAAITDKKAVLPDDFDWTSALKLAKKHQIIPIVYYGIISLGIKIPKDVFAQIENITYQSIAISHNQLYELEKIYRAFEDSGIEYMPLKGAVIKILYPKPEMRVMGDAYILIKTEQYEKIRAIMRNAGFKEAVESDHELIWNKNNIHLELHKRLIPSYNKDYYAYYGDGWDFAKSQGKSRFEMSDEDTFIYIFTHYAKHYRDGGIGIRHITDIYIYLSAKPDLNKEYIESELKKLKLFDFYNNTVHTINVWFNGEQPDTMSDFITEKIFESGSYGTYVSHIMSSAVKASNSGRNVRIKRIIRLLIPSYRHMCEKYPVLVKVPLFLPVMWIVRLVDILFKKRDGIDRQRRELSYITEENINKYKHDLNYVGLDFNFKD